MAKRRKKHKLIPLDKYRYAVLAALAIEIDAEVVEDAENFARGLCLDNLHLLEWGNAIIEQAYEDKDGDITWGPLAPPVTEPTVTEPIPTQSSLW